MPTPVACLLKSPEMTFSFARYGASGSRLRLNCMLALAPVALQCGGLMQFPMKRTARSLGPVAAAGCSAQPNGNDSSHGKAIVQPTPERKVRRVSLCDRGSMSSLNEGIKPVRIDQSELQWFFAWGRCRGQ